MESFKKSVDSLDETSKDMNNTVEVKSTKREHKNSTIPEALDEELNTLITPLNEEIKVEKKAESEIDRVNSRLSNNSNMVVNKQETE